MFSPSSETKNWPRVRCLRNKASRVGLSAQTRCILRRSSALEHHSVKKRRDDARSEQDRTVPDQAQPERPASCGAFGGLARECGCEGKRAFLAFLFPSFLPSFFSSRHEMADMTELRASYAMSPVLAGFLGAGVLVAVVIALLLLWAFCQRRYLRASGRYKLHSDRYCDAEDPPYKFIHMLKGISIYPESLSGSKRIVRGGRRAERDGERGRAGAAGGAVPADASNNVLDVRGQLQMSRLAAPGGSARAGSGPARLERALPVHADYFRQDGGSTGGSQSGSETASPFTPASSEAEPEAGLGAVSLTVDYNFPKKALVVTVVGARGLPAMDEQAGTSDPYVKMTILPEKKHRVKTRVLRKTLDPLFDETFTFYGVAYSSLPDLTLHFLVLSCDRFARDDVIGEAVVPLEGVDPSTGRVHLTRRITKRNMQCESRGELLASLSYQPVSHRLSVVVLKARHLPKMDIAGLSANPYVKVNVFYGRKRIAKKKTHVKKCTLNPVFNESFIYDIPPELLPEISVEFLVVDFDRTAKNEVLGRLLLGLHGAAPSGAAHWREVCENPRRQISKWHNLSEF